MPKQVSHELRRDTIAQAAAKLIAQGGMENVTIRAVAQAAECSKGIVEHYFNSKKELVAAALDWANDQYLQRTAKAVTGLKGLAALRVRIREILPLDDQVRDEWRVRLVFWTLASQDEATATIQTERFQSAWSDFASDLKVAKEIGELPTSIDCESSAEHLLHCVTGLSCSALHSPGLYNNRRLLTALDHFITTLH